MSFDAVQLPLVIVHKSDAVLPAASVAVVLFAAALEIVALPLSKLHAPVPAEGAFAASVNVLLLH